MKNILFIAPHPDDEIVGAAFIIKKILKKKNVFIFFPTNGLISREKMWPWERYGYQRRLKLRLKEMKRSVKALNIRKFYLQNLPSRTLKDNISKTYIKIKKIIKSEKIDTIFCPAYEGGHQDHDVSNFICSRLKKVSSIYEYPEYNFSNRKVNSNSFVHNTKNQKNVYLTANEKKNKAQLLAIYASEKKNLNYLSFTKESYRKIIDYDYSSPPHSGKLFYRRFSFFSWHPRVDSDTPRTVSEKIINSKIF